MEDSISDTSSSSGSVEHVSTSILVAVVLLLFMVIVVVFFIGLYARRNWHRRAAATDQTHPTRRFVFNFAPTPDPVHKGLEPSLLRDLPVLIFHSDMFMEGIECAVCLSKLKEGDKARLLPGCNHGFHVECINMWFQSHSTCPLCRTMVGESSPQFEYLQNNSASGCSIQQPNFRASASSLSNSRSKAPGQPMETCSSSSSCAVLNVQNASPEGSLVIEIPSRTPKDEFNSLSPSTPASRFSEDGMKSPMTTQLRTLRRLLTREKRLVPSSPGFVDVEQGGGGGGAAVQSSIPITETTSSYW